MTSGVNELSDDPTDYDGLISMKFAVPHRKCSRKVLCTGTQDASGANNNVSLLGMPEETRILYGPTDKSLMRNAVVFELGEIEPLRRAGDM